MSAVAVAPAAQAQKYAMMDRGHCLMPGLFRLLGPGERIKSKLDLTHKIGDKSIRVMGHEPLSVDDLRVLLAVVHRAGLSGKPADTQAAKEIALADNAVVPDDIVSISTSIRQIATIAGYGYGGEVTRRIRACLTRLHVATIAESSSDSQKVSHTHIIAAYSSTSNRSLTIAINPRLSAAALGGQHTHIALSDMCALKDVARLLYVRLSGWIDRTGSSRKIQIDKMIRYVWPSIGRPDAERKRRQRILLALNELRGIGWTVSGGVATIRRPLSSPPL